jgi:hypothetical protein
MNLTIALATIAIAEPGEPPTKTGDIIGRAFRFIPRISRVPNPGYELVIIRECG